MRLQIRHETSYVYTAPVHYSIQQLRLTPRSDPHQRVLSWQINAPARMQRFTDAYGNVTHALVLSRSHESVRVFVDGVLEVDAIVDGCIPVGPALPGSQLSPLVFEVPTHLTAANDAIRDLGARHLGGTPGTHGLLGLAADIRDVVRYESGYTEVTSTAAQALGLGHGVCQDHAHLFIACCRASGVPARYVSGYVHPGDTPQAASHAWADAWLEDRGWVSIDVTHAEFAGERHCRLAIGRDYLSAAPVRGVRTGGGKEALSVNVTVFSGQ
jgi:transglutaminase-like putative cysteine protease